MTIQDNNPATAVVIPAPRPGSGPPTVGQGLPYPDNYSDRDITLADQRHAQVRAAAADLVEKGTAMARAGFSVTDAGVHTQFTIDNVDTAIRSVASDCLCPACFQPVAMLLIGELSLRLGAALADRDQR